MKKSLTITSTFRLPVHVEFPIEFDSATGEVEIVGHGNIVQAPDILRKRQIREDSYHDELDDQALTSLISDGSIPRPKINETVMLHGEEHVFDPDDFEEEEFDELTPAQLIGRLVLKSEISGRQARRGPTRVISVR